MYLLQMFEIGSLPVIAIDCQPSRETTNLNISRIVQKVISVSSAVSEGGGRTSEESLLVAESRLKDSWHSFKYIWVPWA